MHLSVNFLIRGRNTFSVTAVLPTAIKCLLISDGEQVPARALSLQKILRDHRSSYLFEQFSRSKKPKTTALISPTLKSYDDRL